MYNIGEMVRGTLKIKFVWQSIQIQGEKFVHTASLIINVQKITLKY